MTVSAPRWDLSNVYPSLESKEFKAAIEDYKKQVSALETVPAWLVLRVALLRILDDCSHSDLLCPSLAL